MLALIASDLYPMRQLSFLTSEETPDASGPYLSH